MAYEGTMLQQLEKTPASEHWGDVNNLITKWLMERQELIRLYCSLTDSSRRGEAFKTRLDDFCELLMDYLSAGHFEVFSELEDEARAFDAKGLQLVNALYPYLEQSTEVALWFNDRCEQLRRSRLDASLSHIDKRYEKIHADLSYLGESLTDRFELEDQLIEYVHKSNRVIAAL